MADSSEDRHLPRWRALDGTEDVRRRTMRAMRAAERILYDAYDRGDQETALSACTRLQQCARTYLKALEVDELESRLERVEQLHERLLNSNGAANAHERH